MKPRQWILATSLTLLYVTSAAVAGDKYTLRYRFAPGEEMRWKVVHQNHVKTIIRGVEQTTEVRSESTKSWQFSEESTSDSFIFTHSVTDARMRQKVSGRDEVRWESRAGEEPPVEFRSMPDSLDIPLVTLHVDELGKVQERKEHRSVGKHALGTNAMVVPLPEQPVEVGEEWTLPHNVQVTTRQGAYKQIVTRRRYTLQDVKNGVATIGVQTLVLSPINDPSIEAQLIQELGKGTIKFDLDAGYVISQQLDVDEQVVGFNGPESTMHFVGRFTEELAPDADLAQKPTPPKF